MIVLSRARSQAINIGGLVLTVVEIAGDHVRFSIKATDGESVRLYPDDDDAAGATVIVGPSRTPPGHLAAAISVPTG